MPGRNWVNLCRNCYFTSKYVHSKCPTCGQNDFLHCSNPPRKNASKRVWKKFFEPYDKYQQKREESEKDWERKKAFMEWQDSLKEKPVAKKTLLEKLDDLLNKKKKKVKKKKK